MFPREMSWKRQGVPIEPRCFKGLYRIWIGNTLTLSRVFEQGEMGKLIATTFGNSFGQVPVEVAKKQKWSGRAEFLSHEQEWRGGTEKENCGRRSQGAMVSERDQAVSECAIPDLVVILKKRNKR